MTTCFLAPDPVQSTFFIPGGNTPGNGVQVFFYVAGSVSTKQTVYKDPAAAVAWTNPIVLDSGGNLPLGGEVWFPSGQTFKVVWAPSNDSDPPASPYRTMDNLPGINDNSSSVTSGEWTAGPAPTFVSGTSFTLVGDQTAIFKIGRRIKTTNTGGTVYSTITNSVFGALTAVTLQNDSGALDAGLSAVFYSTLSSDHISVPQSTLNAQPQTNARLTIVSGNPVPADTVGTTAIYVTPYGGNTMDFYDGVSNWNRFTFAEVSTAIPTTTIVHDVFMFMTTGAARIETVAWATNTSRASALTTVGGVPLKASDNRRYIGSVFPTASTGVISDTFSTRTVFNYWNQVDRPMGWLATTGSALYPNASSALYTVFGGVSSVAVINAVYGVSTLATVWHMASGRNVVVTTAAQIRAAVGVDSFNNGSTGTLTGQALADGATNFCQVLGNYIGIPGIGLHTFAPVIFFQGASTFLWAGTSSSFNQGMAGTYKG